AIAGAVHDPSGALISGAQVEIVGDQTNLTRFTETTTQGTFRASLLPPGSYSVKVNAKGFEPTAASAVQVTVAEVTSVSINMAAGRAFASVTVEAEPVHTSALGRVTDETMIQKLPLANRNFTQILALSPGVAVEIANATAL